LSDLGSSLLGLMQIEQAEPILLRGMALAESLKDESPLLVAELSHSLGNLFLAKLQFDKAEQHHLRALKLRQENLPDDDILIAISYNEVATTLINSWDIDRALPYAEQALARFEKALPAGHHWIGNAQNNLSVVLTRQGRYAEAVAMLRKALHETAELLGENHLNIADYWHNIAVNLAELGEREEAMAAMEKHLDILAQVLGPKAVRTLEAKHEIAHMAFFNDDFEAALTGYRDIMQTHQDIMGERSIHALDTELDVVKTLIELERFAEAEEQLGHVIPLLEAVAGPDNQRSLRGRLLQARLTGRQGDPSAATAQLDDIYDKGLAVLPARSILMGQIYEELTRQEIAKGAYQTAIAWGHKALDHWSIFHSNHHIPHTHELLGRANLGSGNMAKAHEHFREAVSRYRQLLPGHHPRRVESEKALIEIESAAQ
ncbi:MAG: tetratricopeptide repeat protein, partial [Candidatus Competibacteraceae bacterium]